MKTKRCNKCLRRKDLAAFYKGHSECKTCVITRVKAHREANLEAIREYDRQRGQLPHRKAEVKARRHLYRGRYKTPSVTQSIARAAQVTLGNAVRDGRISKKPCEKPGCRRKRGVHGHHEDYTKPLDVIWLCPKHHGERHRELNELGRDPDV